MFMKPSPIPIFVISLPEAKARQERISALLASAGLDFTFVDAIDGRGFDMKAHPAYNRTKRLRYFGRDMTGAELGCTLSHKKIYEMIINQNIAEALIFEDDIILHDNFITALNAVLACPVSYDCVRFFGTPKILKAKKRKIYDLTEDLTLNRLCATPGGAYAYVITNTGAQKLLAHLHKNTYPIDGLMGRSWQTGLNWLTVLPLTAYVDMGLGSFIGDQRFDKKLQITGLRKILYPFTRAWFKLCETTGKQIWFARTWFKDRHSL